ncbi:hypothetical protein U1Q18_006137 [Sarracenia purpurea var. burkii]
MAGGGDNSARELDQTPTWAVALVCAIIVLISILLEKILHGVGEWFRERRKKPMLEALEKIKAELMVLGFISLLLTFGQNYIARICIPLKVANTMLPCPKYGSHYEDEPPGEDEHEHHRRLLWNEHRFLASDSPSPGCKMLISTHTSAFSTGSNPGEPSNPRLRLNHPKRRKRTETAPVLRRRRNQRSTEEPQSNVGGETREARRTQGRGQRRTRESGSRNRRPRSRGPGKANPRIRTRRNPSPTSAVKHPGTRTTANQRRSRGPGKASVLFFLSSVLHIRHPPLPNLLRFSQMFLHIRHPPLPNLLRFSQLERNICRERLNTTIFSR